MFSRRDRYPRSLFSAAHKNGIRRSSEHFRVIIPHEGRGYAVVIPKKVIKSAVGRHKLKRTVFSLLRELPRPTALIVFPKAEATGVHYQDLKTELIELLSPFTS